MFIIEFLTGPGAGEYFKRFGVERQLFSTLDLDEAAKFPSHKMAKEYVSETPLNEFVCLPVSLEIAEAAHKELDDANWREKYGDPGEALTTVADVMT